MALCLTNRARKYQLIKRDAAGNDVIVLDVGMPGMDGLAVLRRLRVGGQGPGALRAMSDKRDVLQELPMEFAAEAQKLVAISLEGAVG